MSVSWPLLQEGNDVSRDVESNVFGLPSSSSLTVRVFVVLSERGICAPGEGHFFHKKKEGKDEEKELNDGRQEKRRTDGDEWQV